MYNDYEDMRTFRRYVKNKDSELVNNYILPGETFVEVTQDMVPGIYDYYQVSNFGRVYHNYLHIIMKPGLSTSGYNFFILSTENGNKVVQLHRLVMIAFHDIPDRDSYQVNHINGDKTCNCDWNLEWVTRSENVLHAYRIGLQKIGEEHSTASISEATAIKICELLEENKYTQAEIASITNSTVSIVNHIKQGNTWTHISCNYEFTKNKSSRIFTDEQVHNLCNYFKLYNIGNLSINDYIRNALEYYNYDISDKNVDSARKIYTGKYYTHISKNYKCNSIVQRLSPLRE